jgi:hypothetical protein
MLEFLTGKARAALPILRGAAARGLSPGEALGLVESAGIRTFRTVIFDIYAALQGLASLAQYIRLQPLNEPLPYEAHSRNVQPQPQNYSYVVRVFHAPSNREQYMQFNSEVPLSPNQIGALTESRIAAKPYEVSLEDLPDASIDIIEANTSLSAP